MKTVSLSGAPRAHVGKKDAKALRAEGNVPFVLYGGNEQIHGSVPAGALKKLVYTPDVYQIELTVGDNNFRVVIQEMQFHPVSDEILHVDFLQLFDDKPVAVKLPVRLTGNAPGILAGGKLAQNFRRVKVKGLPGVLPEAITVDISDLGIGDSVRVRDLAKEGLSMLEAEGAVVVAVRMARGAKKDEEEEEAAEGAEGEAAPAEEGAAE